MKKKSYLSDELKFIFYHQMEKMSHQFCMMNEIWLVEAKRHDQYYPPLLYFDNILVYNHQLNCKEQYQVTKFLNKVIEVLINH